MTPAQQSAHDAAMTAAKRAWGTNAHFNTARRLERSCAAYGEVYHAEMLQRALEAVRAEHLQNPPHQDPTDIAYDMAVTHCEEAILALIPDAASKEVSDARHNHVRRRGMPTRR